MTLQDSLPIKFINAIELEQDCDSLKSAKYLSSFSPKKLAALGLAVINLTITNTSTALGGQSLIELSTDSALSSGKNELSVGSLKNGDIVRIDRMSSSEVSEETSVEGVITRMHESAIRVSVKEDTSNEKALSALFNNTANEFNRMWIVKLTNTATYKRMIQAMKRLSILDHSKKSTVIRILLGEQRFSPRTSTYSKMRFWDGRLNQSQKDAIEFAMYGSPVTIVHGPPGTGKTFTLIELIKQLKFVLGEKVLVCGASNVSVDNILERLSPVFEPSFDDPSSRKSRKKHQNRTRVVSEKLIRIGHPARLLPSNLCHSLDILANSRSSERGANKQHILQDIEKDLKTASDSLKKCKTYSERKALWGEVRQLKREMKERAHQITQDLILNADVVLSTLHGAGSNELYSVYKNSRFDSDKPLFDTIIIDEVSQSLEPQCWIPLINHLGCQRLIIAGDNQQLPPSVESSEEALLLRSSGSPIADLQKTLFDRLMDDHNGSDFRRMLKVQYRMNTEIMSFASQKLYGGRLTADESVKNILLSDLDGVASTDETSVSCVWYDTQGGDFPEQMEESRVPLDLKALNGSKFNDMEVIVVRDHVKKLIAAGVQLDQIGIISPYSAQVGAIKRMLSQECSESLEVSTIDGFQGREKEAMIVSLVRSNDVHEVGFLSDFRRLNVAMTRSKRHICVVGDMELLSTCGVQYLRDWVEFAEDNYEVRYPNLTDY